MSATGVVPWWPDAVIGLLVAAAVAGGTLALGLFVCWLADGRGRYP